MSEYHCHRHVYSDRTAMRTVKCAQRQTLVKYLCWGLETPEVRCACCLVYCLVSAWTLVNPLHAERARYRDGAALANGFRANQLCVVPRWRSASDGIRCGLWDEQVFVGETVPRRKWKQLALTCRHRPSGVEWKLMELTLDHNRPAAYKPPVAQDALARELSGPPEKMTGCSAHP